MENSIDGEQIKEVYGVRHFENMWDVRRMGCSSVGFWAPASMYYHSLMRLYCSTFATF